jgi:hypothetical protein
MPILPGDFGHLNRNEFLEATERVSVAEGSNVVERPLLAIVEKCEVLGAHPRIRHRSPGGIETAAGEDIVATRCDASTIDGYSNPLQNA